MDGLGTGSSFGVEEGLKQVMKVLLMQVGLFLGIIPAANENIREMLTSHQNKRLLETLPADTTPLMHRPIPLLHLLVSKTPRANNGWAIAYGSLLGYSDGTIPSLRSKLALGQPYTHCLRLSPTLDPFILSGEVNGV